MRQLHSTLLLAAFFITAGFSVSYSQSITRGPYLQSPGPNSIIIRWRTDSLTDSRVYYGNTIGSTANVKDSATLTTEHRVLLTGLTPLTTYYYSVGSSTGILRSDSSTYFKTGPDSTSHVPVRFWAIGDFGHGNAAQAEVRESYIKYAAQTKPADVQLWLGDNAYSDGTDAEFQNKVFDTVYGYAKLFPNLPFVATSGNHDYNSICPWQDPNGIPVLCNQNPDNHTGPYLSLIDPPTQGELGGVPSNRKLFYSMDYGDVHIIVLNSELGSYNSNYNWTGVLNNSQTFTSPMLDWLKQDLQACTKKWKIAIWHQTPYSGQDNFTEENSVQIFCTATRHHFNPIIEQYGVDMVLTGHDHNYQRSYLINGHYGGKTSFTAANMVNGTSGNEAAGLPYVKYTNGPVKDKGTVYVLEGNSSEGNPYTPISHPAIYWGEACDTCYGSFVFDVDGDRLDGYYLSSRDTVMDRFTILKQQWTGVEETPNNAVVFSVFPNPAKGSVSVSYTINQTGRTTIDLLDINGRLIRNFYSGNLSTGHYTETYNLQQQAAGTYLLKLTTGSTVKYQKLVVE